MLRRARQGDRQTFLALLRRYDPRLRRLTLRLLADPQRLDRVLSRAYLKAWRSLPFISNGEPAAKWLYRVVYNACINEMRWEPDRPPPALSNGSRVALPAAPVERRLTALRALKPSERIALVLVDGEGFSLEAASGIMRRSATDVSLDLRNARTRWRAYVMGEKLPDEPEEGAAAPARPTRSEVQAEATGNGKGESNASIGPAPLEIRTALGRLAGPIAPKEPGGHVKLLRTGSASGLRPRAANQPKESPAPAPVSRPTSEDPDDPEDEGEVGQLTIVRPESAEAPESTETTEPRPAKSGGSGAGARRKRRRDSKRRSRSGAPSRSSAEHAPAQPSPVARPEGSDDK